jgi:hypothetical protein
MNLDSTKSLNYLKKIPEFYREVVKCWNLSGGGQTKSPVTFIDIILNHFLSNFQKR